MTNENLIKEVIQRFKDVPTTTLTQFTNWLNTKQWWEAATVKYFMYRTAVGLAQYHGITLSDYTENVIFTQVRNWLSATELRKIEKVIFNR